MNVTLLYIIKQNDMTKTERENAVILIHRHCVPSRAGERYDSHSLKACFEDMTGCHISNDEFKGMMVEAGIMPLASSLNKMNHSYRLKRIKPEAWSRRLG